MCNLSDLVIERGIEQGIERGIESGIEQKSHNLAQMMIREAEPIKSCGIRVIPWRR